MSAISEAVEGELPASEEHRYFRAIEAVFVDLRGAPLLLSPSDWRVAQGWYRQGIPLDLVTRGLTEIFAKRAERGATGFVSSLRYCARAIEALWAEARELQGAAASRRAEPAFDLEARLGALAAALPADLADRERWAAALEACAGDGSEATEAALESLDHELLAAVLGDLDGPAREALEAEVEAALARLGDRLAGEDRVRTRERLQRDRVRRRLGLPVLSLFAPEAEEGR
ncbi:MAG: hypothetical protein SF066_14925 [Thermoanaerobaculia bacterium]|nr:hypothetical protein [Thermoanaerobaculia bacterium]